MIYRIPVQLTRPDKTWHFVLRVFFIVFAALVFSPLSTSQLNAQSVPLGAREKVLTITIYNIAGDPEGSREITLDIKDLEKYPLVSVRTETQWTDGVLHFRGPLMRDILRAVGADGDTIRVDGLDGRSAVIPRKDVEKYDVIIAYRIDDAYFDLRDRGPLWIVYPWSDNPELQSAMYYERGIFHLSALSVTNQ